MRGKRAWLGIQCLFKNISDFPLQDEKRNTDDHGSEFSKEVGGKEQEMAAIEAEEEAERQRKDVPPVRFMFFINRSCSHPLRRIRFTDSPLPIFQHIRVQTNGTRQICNIRGDSISVRGEGTETNNGFGPCQRSVSSTRPRLTK